ncbi:MAG: ATP-binding protein [Anaerolineales bacterium]|jgi:two-component system OmpR family sensor kinase/two-component system sensor histidine kinase BaeS|nr:ATP-binding protein [Anaerolineales bacterium]
MNSMRSRLLASFAIVLLVSIASVVLIARQTTAREVQAFMFRGSMIELDSLASDLEAYYESTGSWQGVESLLPRGQSQGSGMGRQGIGMMNQRIRLADQDGQVLVDTSSSQQNTTLSAAERQTAVILQVRGARIGYLLVESGTGMSANASGFLLARLNRAALVSALIGGGIALLLALILAERLVRPMRELTRASRQMAKGDLSQRVPIEGKDELAGLGQAFNQMAGSLQQANENRQAMTADIAHELRTPLSVQRAHLEAIQDGIYPASPESLQPVLEQNLLLTRLVEDLRTLALADAGQLRLEVVPVEFLGLLERIIERFQPQAKANGIDLSLIVSPALQAARPILQVDPIRIEQILGNLLSNALRYLSQGGSIVVDVERRGKTLAIQVRDSGPGISPEALAHIFERFYRADKSRSRSEGGSGLGLAIARQLAEAHGGTLTAANVQPNGAIFTLTLPYPTT